MNQMMSAEGPSVSGRFQSLMAGEEGQDHGDFAQLANLMCIQWLQARDWDSFWNWSRLPLFFFDILEIGSFGHRVI